MKRKLALLVVIVIFMVVGVLCVAFDMKTTEAKPGPEVVIVLPDDELMLVVWLEPSEIYYHSIPGPATFVVENNKMYHNGKQWLNNMNMFGYGVYRYQIITPKMEWDEDCQCPIEVPQYIEELNLQPLGADDLPHSQHIAKLIGIDQQAAKPAIVARKFLGEVYTVNCLVSQSAFDMYQAGDLKLGDYVIVSFIDEIPDTTELNIAIVVDKVVETW